MAGTTDIDARLDEVRELIAVESGSVDTAELAQYRAAADIASRALNAVVEAAVPGAKVADLCELGDVSISSRARETHGKAAVNTLPLAATVDKTVTAGIAFPTCVSINRYVCDVSPVNGDALGEKILEVGDLVRVELAAHVSGRIARTGTTLIVSNSDTTKSSSTEEEPEKKEMIPMNNGKYSAQDVASVLCACNAATEAVVRTLTPGRRTSEVAQVIEQCASQYDVTAVQGSMISQMGVFTMDGGKTAVANPPEGTLRQLKDDALVAGETYSLDILFTTGGGKLAPAPDQRTTVYRRNPAAAYKLKLKTSREFLSDVIHSIGDVGFSLRHFSDSARACMGVVECMSAGLLIPYEVHEAKTKEVVGHVVCTVMVRSNEDGGPIMITEPRVRVDDAEPFVGQETISKVQETAKTKESDLVKELLATVKVHRPSGDKKRKKKKKKTKKAAPVTTTA